MIDGLHHISLAVLDLETGIRAYRELLGREPTMRTAEDGVCCAYFRLENTALRIVAPRGDSSKAEHIRQRLGTGDQGALFGLAFEVADADQTRRHLKRISLWPDTAGDIEVRDMFTPNVVAAWRQITFENRSTDSVNIELVQPMSALPVSNSLEDAPVLQADLVVVRTAEPERALAFYGARLDLKLIFDRINADTGNRLAQFSCGSMLLEVSHNPRINAPGQPDTIWGIGWSVADAEATHRRLCGLGRDLSPIKDGTQPGTKVFTVRDGTCGIPTLVVQHVHRS